MKTTCVALIAYISVIVDFPRDRVPVVIGPLLYPETEDISVDKLTFVTNMPKTHVSRNVN
jgi:hypothetical protein